LTTPRDTSTDPRIDDRSKKVEEGFEKADKKMDAEFLRWRKDGRGVRPDRLRRARTPAGHESGLRSVDVGLLCGADSIIGLLIRAHGL
jgi:hypothetical protein